MFNLSSSGLTKQGSLTAFSFVVSRFNATLSQNNPLQSRSCLRRYVSISKEGLNWVKDVVLIVVEEKYLETQMSASFIVRRVIILMTSTIIVF